VTGLPIPVMGNKVGRTRPIGRREFVSMAGALGATLPFAAPPTTAAAATRKPNIVFILADDLGYADLSSYGRPDIATPNIDRIGREGVRLLQAYANSAVCSATRAALITGRYQYRLRVGLDEPVGATPDVGLPPQHPTLPSLLRAVGYGTTLIGKWHLGARPPFGPLQSGYEHFYGLRGGGIDYYAHTDPGHNPDLWEDDLPIEAHGYATDLLGDRAVRVLGENAKRGKPFLLSLHFTAPHWPWEAPGDEAESERLAGKSLFDFDGGTQATYRKMVERLDFQVGRVLATLEANGLARDTIVVFTSDNGGERFADTWPFTGKKTELLEGGLRIPALVRWPARIAPGRTHEQVAISMDWFPTLLAAAGAAPDADFPPDGISLLPALTENASPVPRRLYWRYKANAQRAVRDGDFKVLKILDHTFLFNVVEDPLERANLKDRHRDIYERLVREWNAWNATMLPEVRESNTASFAGSDLADHYGAAPTKGEIDDPTVWPK
jgi:arylsulfatase A-like enzyme